MPAIRLIIVDDHALFRKGLISLLQSEPDFDVVGEAADGAQGTALAERLQPDVILLDLQMPGMGGIEATLNIKKAAPQAGIIMLTVSEEDEDLLAAVRAGINGYLLKNADADDLISAIHRVHQGGSVISPEVTGMLLESVRKAPLPSTDTGPLTPREADIYQLLTAGQTNRQIASSLQLTENTIKSHVRHILHKLGVQSRSQLTISPRNP
jgi:two-component system, NarL family, nitrate/nitrite response regulator NarL